MLPLKVLCRLPASRDLGSAGPTFSQKKVGEKTPAFHSTHRPPQFTKCRPTPPQVCFRPLPKCHCEYLPLEGEACAREGGTPDFKVLLSPLKR